MRGSSSAHGGDKLLTRNIVVVTINYRLGALGYLTTEDSVLPGNYGFLDQVSALRWVQRNIVQFGGNPDNVTLGGFSAGGSSTHLHMMSPMSKGNIDEWNIITAMGRKTINLTRYQALSWKTRVLPEDVKRHIIMLSR
ncbi:Carboxylesterase [Halocaridina rubra]|uniref:Carboxylic ester hydrolase n=1 Tax=Halocaridina rubra TaxID=373956 RepID=A0AAN9A249_HALRR